MLGTMRTPALGLAKSWVSLKNVLFLWLLAAWDSLQRHHLEHVLLVLRQLSVNPYLQMLQASNVLKSHHHSQTKLQFQLL